MFTRNIFARHTAVGLLSLLLIYLFWLSRPEWSAEMRLWRAIGDGAFILLFLTLAVGPLAMLWRPAAKVIKWRRELGIWFALTALVHGVLILNGWAQWNVLRFLGYEFIPQVNRYVRLEPGFGLANIIGLVGLVWALILAATSSDRATRFLGGSAWRWLHTGAYVIFYLVSLHSLYFLFLHYTLSFHRPVPDPNWFRYPVLVLAFTILLLQGMAFFKVVRQAKTRTKEPDSN